jgi:hypothetical protein
MDSWPIAARERLAAAGFVLLDDGSAEIPVVYDQTLGKLSYFEKTPVWGFAYYRGFRLKIRRLLGETSQA